MRKRSDKIDGNLDVIDGLTFHGVVKGDIHVLADGTLNLHGICHGDLYVARGGSVFVVGTVMGNTINRGGWLAVSGSVEGLSITEAGTTLIGPDAHAKSQY